MRMVQNQKVDEEKGIQNKWQTWVICIQQGIQSMIRKNVSINNLTVQTERGYIINLEIQSKMSFSAT